MSCTGKDVKNEKEKEIADYAIFLSGTQSSDICRISVLSICEDSLLKSIYDK